MYYKNKNMNIGFYCDSAMFTIAVQLISREPMKSWGSQLIHLT